MTESRAAYVTVIPTISDPTLAKAILRRAPVVGVLESETRDGRQVCAATPSEFKWWALRGRILREARARRMQK